MSDRLGLTGLQVEWLRRCATHAATSAPADVLESLSAIGMIDMAEGKPKPSTAGLTFLQENDLLHGRTIRDPRTHW